MPRIEHPFYKGTMNSFPKEKGRGFAEVQASYTKCVPGPGEYKVSPKWGCLPKNQVHKTKKNSYIDQIVANERYRPSPAEVGVWGLSYGCVVQSKLFKSRTTTFVWSEIECGRSELLV